MRALDIAVVIVSFKSADLTIASIRSIEMERSASGLRIRVVVVDNASGDLPAVTQAIEMNGWSSWVSAILAPRNGGFAYGNNLGIRHAYGRGIPDYVYFINPDAQIRSGAISTLVRFLESHPEAGIAGSGIENEDGTDWPIAFRFPGLRSELEAGLRLGFVTRLLARWVVPVRMDRSPQAIDWVCGASMMIRTTVFAAIGGMDESYFLYFEETDFCRRARQSGFPTWYVPESRVMHIRGQSTSVTRSDSAPKRLPSYWFESRRRYFAVAYGVRYAMVVDLAALVAYALGSTIRILLRQPFANVPHFVRDLFHHSILRKRNRNLTPAQTAVFHPSAQCRPVPVKSPSVLGE